MSTNTFGKVEKGMRKGTKSCLECRNKKIKCIFQTNDARICVSCKAKGKTCVEQKKVLLQKPTQQSSKTTLEERVAQLEALLHSQASVGGTHPSPLIFVSNQTSHGSPEGSEVFQRERWQEAPGLNVPIEAVNSQGSASARTDNSRIIDPVGSIFNNAIWKQKGAGSGLDTSLSNGSDHTSHGNFDQDLLTRSSRICDELCRDLPSPRLIASILSATCSWWDTWRTVGNWLRESMAQKNVHTLQEFVNWTLASSDPPFASLGVLCIAISLEQLHASLHEHIIRQLPRSPGELFHEYFDRVYRLIINNNGYSNSRAGIEAIIMSSKTFMNLGLLKMTWILNHRAISHAQLLGLHRPHRILPDETASQMTSRQETWFSLCQNDLYTSLLLGLPYATDGKIISSSFYGARGTLKYFFYRLVRLSARVIDRNQMGHGTSIPDTQDIERDVDTAANELPRDFWDAPAALHQGKINRAEYVEHLAGQFWFFQMKVLLHQPLMIQSIEDHQLLHHRNACFNACRDTLKIYHLMRSDTLSVFGMVKLIDYQAFICSAILLLGLLGYGSLNPVPLSQAIDHYHDWETVQSTLDVLRQASTDASNAIASQAVQGLEALSGLVHSGKTGVCTALRDQSQNCFAKITIPGSGVISIAPGTLMKNAISQTSGITGVVPPPVFHLSHVVSQGFPTPELSGHGSEQATEMNTSEIPDTDFNIPTMEFDWTNMIDMEVGNDWTWLADANAGAL